MAGTALAYPAAHRAGLIPGDGPGDLDAFDPNSVPDAMPAIPPPAPPLPLTDRDRGNWDLFKRNFILPSGRVVDRGVSHTEGQGLGLLFAVAFDDRAVFEQIFAWTEATLRHGNDALHAWRYDPAAAEPVGDPNNATDGDLFIAGALLRAAERWGDPVHARTAHEIARDVLRLLVRKVGSWTVLLPGYAGFEGDRSVIINPSYYVFPMLDAMNAITPSPLWRRLTQDGLSLLGRARFGLWGLPPDWLEVARADGAVSPSANWPARFSYDAVRVPLWLAWSGHAPELTRSMNRFWLDHATWQPAWVDLQTNMVADYPASAGMAAIRTLVAARLDPMQAPPAPVLGEGDDYYSSALAMLARLAALETQGAAVPMVDADPAAAADPPRHAGSPFDRLRAWGQAIGAPGFQRY
ncbi:MAG TPA: glycosyl hydrolase family 8 [Acetobacteraceae bacterium]|nr:glycosyl hydrolase family 8 [Acetobacteraceae bacterium]